MAYLFYEEVSVRLSANAPYISGFSPLLSATDPVILILEAGGCCFKEKF